jgi:hypothetical protein
MTNSGNRKKAIVRLTFASLILTLLAALLLPSSVLARPMGWVRCAVAGNDICFTDGRVGIGTSSPRDFVHLYQDAPVTVGVLMGNSYVGNDRSGFLVNYHWSGEGAELWNFENTDMWFGTNNSRRMTIENDGDIGIGTSNPNSRLEVSNGYIELDTSNGMPPAADCDATDEVGRMKVDSVNTNLYICTSVGWVANVNKRMITNGRIWQGCWKRPLLWLSGKKQQSYCPYPYSNNPSEDKNNRSKFPS